MGHLVKLKPGSKVANVSDKLVSPVESGVEGAMDLIPVASVFLTRTNVNMSKEVTRMPRSTGLTTAMMRLLKEALVGSIAPTITAQKCCREWLRGNETSPAAITKRSHRSRHPAILVP